MTDSFDLFCIPVIIMSGHLGLKYISFYFFLFLSYSLHLNTVTNLSKLSIIESRDSGSEPPVFLKNMAYVQY